MTRHAWTFGSVGNQWAHLLANFTPDFGHPCQMLSWVTLSTEQSDVAPATAEDQALAATAVVIPLDNRRKRNGGGSPRKGGRSSNKGPGVSNLFEPTEDAVAKAFAKTYAAGSRPGTVANCSMWPATAGPLGSDS